MPFTSLYTQISDELVESLKQVRMLVCDVDGVFSDGRIYLGNQGEELKAFHTRDGYGVKALSVNGFTLAVITGRRSRIVEDRMRALSVKHIVQGEDNKKDALKTLMAQEQLTSQQIAAIGDDMPDTGMYDLASVRIAVADAHPVVKAKANWITTMPGGFGAVREVADTLLQVHNKLAGIQGMSI
ncbi:3-deoxy-manno-octulosonate-8-phosphatase KdsC [Alteromonas sediminis]|uniref:3-deoxy-D-manno-octulosonate 8-phosphate phosphatase KdsC n=1 Tax=Alteromonas sediminis TaxID=2259342 RepID=A0A3N5Y4K0_9ALTE|nr:3-deoxy-manno-octulosonate-8-phosphatase KdsC [Alteromonas sediminis]RPJ68063.1 3-deoxy-manno-octulosonate-8-phosphatase KdsC [Alteromonas sediminis]